MQIDRDDLITVCGAGGFIGGHLVADLLRQGHRRVRAVDIKPFNEWYQRFPEADNQRFDLQLKESCDMAVGGSATVYNLAADMGGMGFIEANKGLCMLSVLINTHLLMAAREASVQRYFFSSSACVYAADKQVDPDAPGLKESDPTRRCRRTATAGKNSSASGCAAISARTSGW